MKGLRKRPDGRWEGRFHNKNRTPQSKSVYFDPKEYTKYEIEDMWSQMRKAYKSGEFDPWMDEVQIGELETERLGSAIKVYLEKSSRENAQSTTKIYEYTLGQLKKHLGANCRVNSITTYDLEGFINQFKKYSTRDNKTAPINNLFEMLYSMGTVDRLIRVSATGGEGRKPKDYISYEEFIDLEKYFLNDMSRYSTTDYHNDIWYTAFMLGLRADEALNIKPSWFKKDMSSITYGDEAFQPKSRTTDNLDTLPILSEAKERLSEIIHRKSPDKPIFDMTNYDNLSYFFKKAADEKFPKKYLTFHSLRKSFAMYLVNDKRLHPKELHEMMRHKDMNTTMTYYTDIDLDRLDQAINGKLGHDWVKEKITEKSDSHKQLTSSNLRLVKSNN